MAAVTDADNNSLAAAAAQAEFRLFASEKVYEYRSLLKMLETPALFNAMASAAMTFFRDHKFLFDL